MSTSARLTIDALLDHQSFVLALARSLVRDEHRAHDLAQETWMRALERLPEPGSLRGWLARVLRNQARNDARAARRRTAHEALAASAESVDAGPTPGERLELSHGVVAAVLALTEPYKSVIVATYYEGLAPREIALRQGIPASTVRSQLTRAHTLLRSALDREHGGDRNRWRAALIGWVGAPGTAEAGLSASVTSAGVWAGAAGALALAGGLLLGNLDEPGGSSSVVAVTPVASTPARSPAEVRAPDAPVLRAAVEPARDSGPSGAGASGLARLKAELPEDVDGLIERGLQVQRLLAERRLALPEDIVREHAWIQALPSAGLVALVDRTLEKVAYDLPWMRGNGVYYSFSRRSHSYDRSPQISLASGDLSSAFYGNSLSALLDVGPIPFEPIATRGRVQGLDEHAHEAWERMQIRLDLREEAVATSIQAARDTFSRAGLSSRVKAHAGHVYILRAVAVDEYDVLVALQVVRIHPRGAVLAWRMLEDRPVPGSRSLFPFRLQSEQVPAAPEVLAALSESDLGAHLMDVRAKGHELLFTRPLAELQAQFPQFNARNDAGLARLVERSSAATVLSPVREGGAYWSFGTRSNSFDEHPDLCLEQGQYRSASDGAVLLVGRMPLERVQAHDLADPLARELLERPMRHLEDPAALRSDLHAWRADWTRAGGSQRMAAASALGQTYLIRSIRTGQHDLLAAFQVLRTDAYGDLIAWRVLRTWRVEPEGR